MGATILKIIEIVSTLVKTFPAIYDWIMKIISAIKGGSVKLPNTRLAELVHILSLFNIHNDPAQVQTALEKLHAKITAA